MNYRRLGRWGLKVSEVSLGGWLTQGRTLQDADTSKIVHRAFDLGINFFDTADIYNKGAAELALSKAIGDLKRQDLVIGTKCFFPLSENPNDRGLSRKHITESLHGSLKRLGTDYVDLYQFHRYDENTPIDESIRAVDNLIRQGKALYWGVSEWSASQIEAAVKTAKELGCHPPVSNQPEYSMLQPRIEAEVMPACHKNGLGIVVFSPLAQGILTGKYEPGKPRPAGSRGADEKSNMFMLDELDDNTLSRVQNLKAYAEKLGKPLGVFALAWCLRRHELTSVIVGATSIEQLEQNVSAGGVTFPDDVWHGAEAILAG